MRTIEDLMFSVVAREGLAPLAMDPLTEEDSLLEAQVLDVRFDALRSRLALLLEMRLALQLREGNAGVFIADGVRSWSWTASPRSTERTAWTIVGSVPKRDQGLFALRLAILPVAELNVVSERAAIYVGQVPGLNEIPDYGNDDEPSILAALPRWDSEFAPTHAAFLDPDSQQ